MPTASTIMTPFETWGGILGIVFIIILSVNFIRQKTTLKQAACSFVLFASAMIFLYFNARDIHIITDFSAFLQVIKRRVQYEPFSLIPFAWITTDILGGLKDHFIGTIFYQYVSTFIFAVIFSFLFPLRYRKCSDKKFYIICAILFLAVETRIFIEMFLSGTECFFDTGNFILIIIGVVCGRTIGKYICEKGKRRSDNS